MKTISRQNLEILRVAIDAAVKAVGEKHGVDIKVGKGKYSNAATGTLSIEISTINADGTVETREAQDFRMLANLYGFEPDDLGRTFTSPSDGKTYTITGLRARAAKMPIIGVDQNGKAFVFSERIAKLVQRPEKVTS
jgi:hypothetical protein